MKQHLFFNSDTVNVTQELINQLKTDLNSTQITQSMIQETLSLIGGTIDSFRYQLQEVKLVIEESLHITDNTGETKNC